MGSGGSPGRPRSSTIRRPGSRKRSATATPCSSSPPGLPRRSMHHALGPHRAQRVHGLTQLVGGVRAEHVHVHVADTGTQHHHARHGAARDRLARDLHRETQGAEALDGERDARSRCAAQQARDLIGAEPAGGLLSHGHDAVTQLHAGAIGRRSRHRFHHRDPAVAHVELQADTAVVARHLLLQPLHAALGEERRVGVVQLVHEPRDRLAVERVERQRIHEARGDHAVDLFEEARAVLGWAHDLQRRLLETVLTNPPAARLREPSRTAGTRRRREHA